MDFIFSFFFCKASNENKNRGQQLNYNKITCERINDQFYILYFLKT